MVSKLLLVNNIKDSNIRKFALFYDIKIKFYFLITLMCLFLSTVYVKSSNLLPDERDNLLKGIYNGCVSAAPRDLVDRFGSIKWKLYCSCYSDEMIKNLTHEDFQLSIIDPKTGKAPENPNTQIAVMKSHEFCLKELSK